MGICIDTDLKDLEELVCIESGIRTCIFVFSDKGDNGYIAKAAFHISGNWENAFPLRSSETYQVSGVQFLLLLE